MGPLPNDEESSRPEPLDSVVSPLRPGHEKKNIFQLDVTSFPLDAARSILQNPPKFETTSRGGHDVVHPAHLDGPDRDRAL